MIRFIGTSITISINYNSSQSVTRSIPYWTMSVFSSTPADLVLIYESVTYETLQTNEALRLNSELSYK
jgi:hypothetical protein